MHSFNSFQGLLYNIINFIYQIFLSDTHNLHTTERFQTTTATTTTTTAIIIKTMQTADCSLRNWKDVAKDPVAQVNNSTLISTSSAKSWQDEKIWVWLGLTAKMYDMVPQAWIIKCLKMYKILDEVINFTRRPRKPEEWH